jgi:hypothetical protein
MCPLASEYFFTPSVTLFHISSCFDIAEKIPGAWLVQIGDSGHGLMYQYPDKFSSGIYILADSYSIQV